MSEELVFPLREITKRIEGKKIPLGKERDYLQDVQHHAETILTDIKTRLSQIERNKKMMSFEIKHSILDLPLLDESPESTREKIKIDEEIIINLFTILTEFLVHEINKLVEHQEHLEFVKSQLETGQKIEELSIGAEPEIEMNEPVENAVHSA